MNKRTDEKANAAIALTLRCGALASTLVMALGVGLLLLRRPLPSLSAASVRALSWTGLWQLDPEAVIRAGILLLLLTPVFRIVVAAVEFALERDLKYALISTAVLAIVILGYVLSIP